MSGVRAGQRPTKPKPSPGRTCTLLPASRPVQVIQDRQPLRESCQDNAGPPNFGEATEPELPTPSRVADARSPHSPCRQPGYGAR